MFDHATGVSKSLGINPPANTLELLDLAVSEGLALSCLDILAESIFPDQAEARKFKFKVAPELNKIHKIQTLNTPTSERVERLARIFALAKYVFDDLDDAREFCTNKHKALKGRTPLDTAMTELGAIWVSQLLHQLYFGVLSPTRR